MPNYCYRAKSGEILTRHFPVGKAPRKLRAKGLGTCHRDIAAEHETKPKRCDLWPMYCDASGVNPTQIPQAIEAAAKQGVKINFTPDGQAILTSPQHRRDYLKVRGLTDFSSYY